MGKGKAVENRCYFILSSILFAQITCVLRLLRHIEEGDMHAGLYLVG